MITRVLFIDSDARALARIKKALEQAGPYEANVFVTGRAALEYAADHLPSLAIIALNVTDIPPTDLVTLLRDLVPGLPVLLRAPADSDRRILETINAQGMVEGGYTARTLVNLMSDALQQPDTNQQRTATETPRTQPDAAPARPSVPPLASIMPSGSQQVRPPLPRSGHPDDDMSTFDEVLDSIEPDIPTTQDDTFHLLVKSMQSQPDQRPLHQRRERLVNWAPDESNQSPAPDPATVPTDPLFEKLAGEEPPAPPLEDSGTVSDLIAVTDFNDHRTQMPVAELPDDMLLGLDDLSETDEQRDLLKAISEIDEPPSREIDLDTLPERLAKAQLGAVRPVPEDSWDAVVEPDTTPSDRPASEPRPLSEIRVPATRPSQRTTAKTEQTNEAAALALQLSAQIGESDVEASALVRDNTIVASAGDLPINDLEALIEAVDCEGVLSSNVTKVKLISLPELHLSYVVAAAPTVENMVLLSIFSENTQLGAIRGQARSIVQAFKEAEEARAAAANTEAPPAETPYAAESVDSNQYRTGTHPAGRQAASTETPPVAADDASQAAPTTSEPATEIDPANLVRYACVWILGDPTGELSPDLIDALTQWVHQITATHGWLTEQIDVQPDYVSVMLGAAAEEAPASIPATLMAETAQRIVAAHPELGPAETVWADAHLMVTPGRPLSGQEISQFISYQRLH